MKYFAAHFDVLKNIHYDLLMMSQKVPHSCVLPRKVDKIAWIFGEVCFEENYVCFLQYWLEGSTQEAHIVAY